MNTTPDVKLMGVALVDGRPLACGGCGNTFSLELHKASPFEAGRAWVSCLACGHGEDNPQVTTGLIDAVLASRLDRIKAADRDAFDVEWRGITMSGELMPLLDGHEIARTAQGVYEGVSRETKGWWRSKKRQVKAKVKKSADEAVAGVKASALTAAWTAQTGGAGGTPESRPTTGRCTVKGCRKGWLTIRTRVHSSMGGTKDVRIPCAVCRRSES